MVHAKRPSGARAGGIKAHAKAEITDTHHTKAEITDTGNEAHSCLGAVLAFLGNIVHHMQVCDGACQAAQAALVLEKSKPMQKLK
jgi:hypothetical protein